MRAAAVVLLAAAVAAACGGPSPGAWREVTVRDLGEEDRARLGKAELAVRSLADVLRAKLAQALVEGGATEAISVCKEAAPALTRSEGERLHVGIGRTSHRLRNPANAPPDWAACLVEQLARDPERGGEPRVWLHDDGRMGITLPIRTMGTCLGCHGPEGALVPEVVEKLAREYPEDRATGFAEGDLRGVFWVEVPPR